LQGGFFFAESGGGGGGRARGGGQGHGGARSRALLGGGDGGGFLDLVAGLRDAFAFLLETAAGGGAKAFAGEEVFGALIEELAVVGDATRLGLGAVFAETEGDLVDLMDTRSRCYTNPTSPCT